MVLLIGIFFQDILLPPAGAISPLRGLVYSFIIIGDTGLIDPKFFDMEDSTEFWP